MRAKGFKTRIATAVTAVMAAGALFQASTAAAGPVVGFDPTGTGAYTTYADLWTNVTDTGLSVGFVPGTLVPPGAPYVTSFTSQAVVGTMSDSNIPAIVTPAGINTTFELSKVIKINETVVNQTLATAIFELTAAQPDIDPVTAGSQQLMIFFDDITDGSQAVPGNGVGTVSCYGAGACANPDGTLIMSAHAVFLAASFTATGPAVGTGSFDIRWVIDYVDPLYLDVVTGSVFGETITGTTNIPPFFNPAQMWDGTLANTGISLKVDSSESFVAAVPEPGTLALLGVTLVGLGFSRRRRQSA